MAAVSDPAPATQPTETAVLDEKTAAIEESTQPTASSSEPSVHEKPKDTIPAPATTAATPPYASLPIAPTGPTKLPIPYPLPTSKPAARPELTADQKAKYEEVLAAVSAWTDIPLSAAKGSTRDPITDDERMWLTKDCILRYLRATKWNVPQAITRLQDTLTWRREYKIATFTPDYISPEQETGKQVVVGYDNEGRPCWYMEPSKQNTDESDRQIHHVVYWLESAITLAPPGQETLALLINYKDSSSAKTPSIATGRKFLNILQGHYPERLGKALICNLPWYFNGFYKLISPFIDPVTKTKMAFNEPIPNYVPASQLKKPYGGDLDFTYDHSVFWPELNAMIEAKRAEYKQRWESRGKKVGDDEWVLKGGEPSATEPSVEDAVEKLAL